MTTPNAPAPRGAKTTRVGVAWRKKTRDGRDYLSVIITNPTGSDLRFTIWPVEQKTSDSAPDYTVTKPSDSSLRLPATAAGPGSQDFPADDEDLPF